jgi:hypothetical protein
MDYPQGASAYAMSTASILLYSSLLGSLEVSFVRLTLNGNFKLITKVFFLKKIFDTVGMKKLREKSKLLTTYLEILLKEKFKGKL